HCGKCIDVTLCELVECCAKSAFAGLISGVDSSHHQLCFAVVVVAFVVGRHFSPQAFTYSDVAILRSGPLISITRPVSTRDATRRSNTSAAAWGDRLLVITSGFPRRALMSPWSTANWACVGGRNPRSSRHTKSESRNFLFSDFRAALFPFERHSVASA